MAYRLRGYVPGLAGAGWGSDWVTVAQEFPELEDVDRYMEDDTDAAPYVIKVTVQKGLVNYVRWDNVVYWVVEPVA